MSFLHFPPQGRAGEVCPRILPYGRWKHFFFTSVLYPYTILLREKSLANSLLTKKKNQSSSLGYESKSKWIIRLHCLLNQSETIFLREKRKAVWHRSLGHFSFWKPSGCCGLHVDQPDTSTETCPALLQRWILAGKHVLKGRETTGSWAPQGPWRLRGPGSRGPAAASLQLLAGGVRKGQVLLRCCTVIVARYVQMWSQNLSGYCSFGFSEHQIVRKSYMFGDSFPDLLFPAPLSFSSLT
jgi:hypothetical protein